MLKIYNTFSRKKEDFIPIDNEKKEVKIYTCGPTVYNRAHIGNMRAYILMDILRKILKYNGYSIKHVMNITDVGHMTSDEDYGEDKMIKGAREQNLTVSEIANKYTELFFKDISRLNIEKTEYVTKATDYIKEMEEYVAKIYENGYAYETSKGIYFDTSKLPSYGELSKINLMGQQAGARIEVDEEKKNPLDFALWIKAPKEHIMKWNSRWGMAYPGWHIECSAMSNKVLGEHFDIHTGGVDHIPIHHENEIAQSRGATGKNPANFWVHSEFLLIDGGKMSKSLKNVYTIDDIIEKGFSPLAFRYFTYTSHYRNKLNFTWKGLEAAQISLNRLNELYNIHLNSDKTIDKNIILEYEEKFKEAINDDLNMPLAMSVVYEVAKNEIKSKDFAKLLEKFDTVLSLNIGKINCCGNCNTEENIPVEVLKLLDERKEARENKDYKLSDILRDKIAKLGYSVLDSKEGQKIKKNEGV